MVSAATCVCYGACVLRWDRRNACRICRARHIRSTRAPCLPSHGTCLPSRCYSQHAHMMMDTHRTSCRKLPVAATVCPFRRRRVCIGWLHGELQHGLQFRGIDQSATHLKQHVVFCVLCIVCTTLTRRSPPRARHTLSVRWAGSRRGGRPRSRAELSPPQQRVRYRVTRQGWTPAGRTRQVR